MDVVSVEKILDFPKETAPEIRIVQLRGKPVRCTNGMHTSWHLLCRRDEGAGTGNDFEAGDRADVPDFVRSVYSWQPPAALLLVDLETTLVAAGAELRVVHELVTHFADRSKARDGFLKWPPRSRLSQLVGESLQGVSACMCIANIVAEIIDTQMTEGSIDYRQFDMSLGGVLDFSGNWLTKLEGLPLMGIPYLSRSEHSRLQGPLGGTQHLSFWITNFSISTHQPGGPIYQYTLRMVVIDDFGVDDNDVKKHPTLNSAPFLHGLVALWLLQHVHGYRPFMNAIVVDRSVRGTIPGTGVQLGGLL